MFTTISANDQGAEVGAKVLAGEMTPEQAGDLWLEVADRNHLAGVAWIRGYDSTGAER